MDEAARLLTLLALVGGALTLVGAAFAYYLDEVRRITRTLTQALGVTPQPMLAARGRGTGIGFDLAGGRICVTWDRGGWRLDYRLEELVGVELIVDDHVAARAFRGDTRRGLDQLAPPLDLVRLRFVFDDPANPDFELDLWRPEDEGRRGRPGPAEALRDANRWMASMEAVLRRTAPRMMVAPPRPVSSPPPPAPAPRGAPEVDRLARAAPPKPAAPATRLFSDFDDDSDEEFNGAWRDDVEDDPQSAIT